MRGLKAFLIACLALAITGCGSVGGWFGFGSDTSKAKPAELVEFTPTVTMERAWDVAVGSARPYVMVPGGDGQSVFVATKEGRVTRIDLASGRSTWQADAGRQISAGVGAGEGLAVVGTLKGDVIAFRAADGGIAWSANVGGEILTTPVVAAGAVAARTTDGRLHLLDSADGKRRWVYSRSQPVLILRAPGEPVLTSGTVFVGYPGGKLAALARANGAPVWEGNVALPRGSTEIERIADVTGPLAVDGRLVCGAAYQGRLTCLDAVNGNPVWSREFSGLGGVAQDENHLFAADDEDAVQSFDKQRGSGIWKQERLKGRKLSTPLPLGRYVAVGDGQGYVHLLDSATGAFSGRVATDGSAIVGRMLPLDKGFVVQTANGGVYAFRVQESRERTR